mgnify:CR=1 FL=1
MNYVVIIKTRLSYGEYGAIYHITRRAFATKETAADGDGNLPVV